MTSWRQKTRTLRERVARWLAPESHALTGLSCALYADETVFRIQGSTPYNTVELRIPRPFPDDSSFTFT